MKKVLLVVIKKKTINDSKNVSCQLKIKVVFIFIHFMDLTLALNVIYANRYMFVQILKVLITVFADYLPFNVFITMPVKLQTNYVSICFKMCQRI